MLKVRPQIRDGLIRPTSTSMGGDPISSVSIRLGRNGQMRQPNPWEQDQILSASCPSQPKSGANLGRICGKPDNGRTRTRPLVVRPGPACRPPNHFPPAPFMPHAWDGPTCQPPSLPQASFLMLKPWTGRAHPLPHCLFAASTHFLPPRAPTNPRARRLPPWACGSGAPGSQ